MVMTPIEAQIPETWRIHNRIMLYMIDHIPEESFSASLGKRGGGSVGHQLKHIQMVRFWKLEAQGRKWAKDVKMFEKGEVPSRQIIMDALVQSGQAIERYLLYGIENGGTGKNFKYEVVPFMCNIISHESHHRGAILQVLKHTGFKLPDALKFGIWDWNKFRDIATGEAEAMDVED